MKSKEFVEKLRDIAENYKTLYIKGCFGAPMTEKNKKRYSNNNDYNKKRSAIINAASADTFGFDCVCLVKGVLWGWRGDASAVYGGAAYASGGVPDVGTEQIIKKCADVSSDFGAIMLGELLHMPGHVGVYIGGGLAVECTPSWDDGVQITAVGNIGKKSGYHTRTWKEHGKLPWVDYTDAEDTSANAENPDEVVYVVVKGDTLSAIAKKYGTTYQALAEYNGIKDVNRIYVGQKIRIPTAAKPTAPAPETPASESTPRTYTVKRGDSLWKIAKEQLGAGKRYVEIMALNGMKSAGEVILPGQVLKLPER